MTLKRLITSLLVFGAGLCKYNKTALPTTLNHGLTLFVAIFAAITWNNSSNDILRSLAVTGIVTVFASIIGLIGCDR